MSRKNWKSNLIFFLVISIILLAITKATAFSRVELSNGEKFFKDSLAPLQGGVTVIVREVSGYVNTLFELRHLRNRNEVLEAEVDELKSLIIKIQNARNDNIRLRELLDFKEDNIDRLNMESAQVIARSPENWFNTITIDKGRAHGIESNMPVISTKGLVGQVTTVTKNSAQVLLILDSRSGVGSITQESRATGVVEGIVNASDRVRMIYIPEDAPLKEGETLITSGLGGVFPKGLAIGTIKEFKRQPSGLTQSAIIEPFVNFNYLEEVFVIKESFELEEELDESEELDAEDNNGSSVEGE